MKNIKMYKNVLIWFIVWISFLSLSTFAAVTWAWTLWSLFEEISGGVYKLVWTNIKDNTVETTQIKNGTIINDDIFAVVSDFF